MSRSHIHCDTSRAPLILIARQKGSGSPELFTYFFLLSLPPSPPLPVSVPLRPVAWLSWDSRSPGARVCVHELHFILHMCPGEMGVGPRG